MLVYKAYTEIYLWWGSIHPYTETYGGDNPQTEITVFPCINLLLFEIVLIL